MTFAGNMSISFGGVNAACFGTSANWTVDGGALI